MMWRFAKTALRKTACAGAMILAAFPLDGLAASRATVHSDRHDFGEVLHGVSVEHRFRIENTGDSPLRIERIRSSCAACTAAVLSGNTIQPGGSAELKISYHAKDGLGRRNASLVIHSNDPVEPFKRIFLSATVVSAEGQPRLRCEPRRLDAGVVGLGEGRRSDACESVNGRRDHARWRGRSVARFERGFRATAVGAEQDLSDGDSAVSWRQEVACSREAAGVDAGAGSERGGATGTGAGDGRQDGQRTDRD